MICVNYDPQYEPSGPCRLPGFKFDNEKKGIIKFQGNILFTHFGEIGEPNPHVDEDIQENLERTPSYRAPFIKLGSLNPNTN